jgi:hypothetical protein
MNTDTYIGGRWVPSSHIHLDAVKELATALAKAQGEIANVKKTSNNPFFSSKYADFASIWEAAREPLTRNGISVLQLPCEAPPGHVGLVTHILHVSGQSISEKYYVGVKDASNPQHFGSAITYMKRYALMGVAGVASEDDDGEAATAPTRATVKKADPKFHVKYSNSIMEQLEKLGDDEAKELYVKVRAEESIEEPHKAELLSRMVASIKARKGNK